MKKGILSIILVLIGTLIVNCQGKRLTKEEQILILAKDQDKPIEFWGKVIDQNGKPVPDVRINYGYWCFSLKEGLGNMYTAVREGNVSTNENGIFKIKCKGALLSLHTITKEGYDSSKTPTPGYDYTKEGLYREGGKPQLPFKKPDPSNPEVFQIRKKGEPTFVLGSSSLIKGTTLKEGEIDSYALCFVVEEEITQRPLGKAKEIGMRIDAVITLKEVGKDYAEVIVEPYGEGGVCISEEKLYVAPERGYKKEVKVELREGQKYYLYFYTGNPPLYTLLEIDCLNLLANGKGVHFEWYSRTNPYGDRNLETYDRLGSIEEWQKWRLDAINALETKRQYPVKPEFHVRWWEERKKKEGK